MTFVTVTGRLAGWGLNHQSLVWWLMPAVSQAELMLLSRKPICSLALSWASSQNSGWVPSVSKRDNQAEGISFLWPSLRSHIASLWWDSIGYSSHPCRLQKRGRSLHVLRSGEILEEHVGQWPTALVFWKVLSVMCAHGERERENDKTNVTAYLPLGRNWFKWIEGFGFARGESSRDPLHTCKYI